MASRSESPWLDPVIARYVVDHTPEPDEILGDLIAETLESAGDWSGMQIAPDQGTLLSILVGVVGARRAVEVGTFTGFSSICIARALAPGGRLLCCDVNEQWTGIARRAWERAGLTDRIELRIGPAIDTLRALPDEPIDFSFIDADKPSYWNYFDELVDRTRPGGLICVDNTLWSGRVAVADDRGAVDGGEPDESTAALRAFNDRVAADSRVESYIVPIGDGLTLARVR